MTPKPDLLMTSATPHQIYHLDYKISQTQTSDEPQPQQFVLQDEADETDRREFDTFEQVIDFVLDELFRPM